ncbi:hypothetical protein [Embleya sp. NPDC005971]|uniref:hypothetical protein n=1 Tax=unclassified Embleya TaxID=2699296 RepID=UPI0033CB07A3
MAGAYSSAKNVTEMRSRTDNADLSVPAGCSGAAYTVDHQLKIVREDGTAIGGEAGGMGFTPYQSHYYVQHPKPSSPSGADDVAALSRAATDKLRLEELAAQFHRPVPVNAPWPDEAPLHDGLATPSPPGIASPRHTKKQPARRRRDVRRPATGTAVAETGGDVLAGGAHAASSLASSRMTTACSQVGA